MADTTEPTKKRRATRKTTAETSPKIRVHALAKELGKTSKELIEVLAGLVTGCVLLRWPGRSRLRRFLLTAAATVGAGWVAVATAWVLVDWTPAAPGVAMVWPVSAVATVFLGSCLAMALWPVPRAEVLPPGRGEVLPSGDPGPRP